MARHAHLLLTRLEGELQRRPRPGFGNVIPRQAGRHGATIAANLDAVGEAHRRRPRIADVDPALILKIRLAGHIDEAEWRRLGLTLLADDPDKTLILFADDTELREFRRRVAAYQQEIPEGQRHPAFAAFVSAIESVGEVTARDRIGEVLRSEGIVDPGDFAEDQVALLDVELWQPHADMAQIFIHRVDAVLQASGGALLSEYRGRAATLVRIQAGGDAIRAILELPEVAVVDRPPRPDFPPVRLPDFNVRELPAAQPPPENAVTIGIVDSGITSAHPFLQPAVVGSFGIPPELGDNDERGHGTPVAGIAVYGDIRQRLESGQINPQFRIASARVVNAQGEFDERTLVPSQMEQALRRLHDEFGCRIINISLGDRTRHVGEKPSAWAATLDDLARELDLVLIVSAGNRLENLMQRFHEQVVDEYPAFLLEDAARIFEPASAINALTIGSIAAANGLTEADIDHVGVRALAERDEPSPFTLSGPGIAEMIKPDLIDYGGTAVFDGPTQSLQDARFRPAAGVLSLSHSFLERLFTSVSGTSFAAPLVAYKAATLLESFPEASANLIRALMALSANHPPAALACLLPLGEGTEWRVCGHGQADVERASGSDDNRVVLFREDSLPLDRFAVYEVPIPEAFQTERGRKNIRVSLAFDPPVRHTRLDYAGVSMGFHLIRGAAEQEVFAAFRRWEAAEGEPFRLPPRLRCSLHPGPRMRERGTLQCGTFTAVQNIQQYGDRYFLAVRCESGWADIEAQRFAIAVELSHEADIRLYQRIVERIRLRA